MNKTMSSNQFRHAMHTYDKDAIGAETITATLQHSEVVAKKHYIHNSKESSAFPRFYDLVTAAKKTSDIEISDATDSETRTDHNMKIRAANLKFWLQTKTKAIPTKLSLMIGSPLPMTNGIWDKCGKQRKMLWWIFSRQWEKTGRFFNNYLNSLKG